MAESLLKLVKTAAWPDTQFREVHAELWNDHARRRIMATLTVEVTIDQLLETIKLLPAGEQAQLFDALEGYFLGKQIEATEGEPLLSREEAMHYLAETS